MSEVRALVTILVVFHVVVFAVAPLYSEHRRRAFRRRFRVPLRPAVAAWTIALVGCVLLAAVGDPPFDPPGGRGEFRAVWGWGLLLVAGTTVGAVGIVGSIHVGRRALRVRTGWTDPPGETVATGRAVPLAETEPEASPVFERTAVCWAWTIEGYERYGSAAWTTARSGSGGVPIRIEPATDDAADDDTATADDARAVTIDPDIAYVDVPLSESRTEPPDAPAPGRLASAADTDVGGSKHRFNEGVIAPGDAVTVVGDADADGRIRDDGALEPQLTPGDRSAVRRRLERRAVGYLLGGVACLLVFFPAYLSWIGLR